MIVQPAYAPPAPSTQDAQKVPFFPARTVRPVAPGVTPHTVLGSWQCTFRYATNAWYRCSEHGPLRLLIEVNPAQGEPDRVPCPACRKWAIRVTDDRKLSAPR